MRRLFFLMIASCAPARAAVVPSAPAVAWAPPVLALDHDRPSEACALHGTGFGAEPIRVAVGTDVEPAVLIEGEHEAGVTWRVDGSARARVDIDLDGVRASGFASITRTFRALAEPASVDGLARPTAGALVRVERADERGVLVSLRSERVRPAIVRGRALCAELGMNEPVTSVPAPSGQRLRSDKPWIDLRRGDAVRALETSGVVLTQIDEANGMPLVAARAGNDVELVGFAHPADVRRVSGGGHGYGLRIGRTTRACPEGREARVAPKDEAGIAELRVGLAPGAVLGTITRGAQVRVTRVKGAWSAVEVGACAIHGAREGESLWVRSSDLE